MAMVYHLLREMLPLRVQPSPLYMHQLSVQLIRNTLIQVNVTVEVCMHAACNVFS